MSERAFARYKRIVRKRYHYFRRFAIGFYDPAFRDLWFTPKTALDISGTIVSVLTGNWRPSPLTRAKIGMFFALVAVQHLVRRVTRPGRWVPKGRVTKN